MLENTEGAIKKGQSRETGYIGYTRRRNTKQKHNTIYAWHHYTQTKTDSVNKTWSNWVLEVDDSSIPANRYDYSLCSNIQQNSKMW